MGGVRLDWSTAEVEKGRLTVSLDGERDKAWKQRFEHAAALLAHGEWGEIGIKKDRIRVDLPADGEEDRLRHFLEAAVLEANAGIPDAEEEDHGTDHDEDRGEGSAAGSERDHDAELTARFRSFAEQ
jgi:hypothetical protein